jgi:acetyl-CoA carboxylase carboxyl transferase subunit alpha
MKKNNLIDKIISEPVGGAHRDRDKTFLNVRNAILNSYDFLKTKDLDVLVEERMNKFTSMGVYNS